MNRSQYLAQDEPQNYFIIQAFVELADSDAEEVEENRDTRDQGDCAANDP